MPRSISSLLVVGIALLAALLIACSSEATPTPSADGHIYAVPDIHVN